MIKFFFIICFLAAAALALCFGTRSCGSLFPEETVLETEDENFVQGQMLSQARRDREAMEAFYKVVNSRGDAAESHLELGIIAMRQDMPLEAIYHFRQYLRQRPDSSQSKEVNEQIKTATVKFLQGLPGRPFETTAEDFSRNLEKKYKAVTAENELLKRQLTEAQQQIAKLGNQRTNSEPEAGREVANTNVKATPRKKEPSPVDLGRPAIPSTHVVVQGDTLSTISKKYYGTSGKWRKIYEYNRDIMRSPSELKLGMKIKLPPQ